ncbi:uncharacterized protein ATC70_002275 [Mucor velutinosus]|uniref:Uncharacterized protein n=1 Tax=Mucor velutinosus TaxID=708070 RepID=A0AAN7DD29_9FUNG|nr:hypothetical protein ATC70_002275 [Mucor velutinosus]
MGKLIRPLPRISIEDSEINVFLEAITLGRETDEYLELLPLVFTCAMKSLQSYRMSAIVQGSMIQIFRVNISGFNNLMIISRYEAAAIIFQRCLSRVSKLKWEVSSLLCYEDGVCLEQIV